jgi:hypothetical protein
MDLSREYGGMRQNKLNEQLSGAMKSPQQIVNLRFKNFGKLISAKSCRQKQ